MKTLHLIRHAKSSWKNLELSDLERPLNNRGKQACRIMALPIWEAGCRFENVFCSPSKRTRSTIKRLIKNMPENDIQWHVSDDLYCFHVNLLLDWCGKLDDSLESVVIVSHNPGLTDLINRLCDEHVDNLPTCGYAAIELPADSWQQITRHRGQLSRFLYPKLF